MILVRRISIASVVILFGCSTNSQSQTTHHSTHHTNASVLPLGVADDSYSMTGSFAVVCQFSHQSSDDPIVFPSSPGKSHLHDFYGASTTNAYSTANSLMESHSTCDSSGDKSAYWLPTLFDGNRQVTATEIAVYYRTPPGVSAHDVSIPPNGLRLIGNRLGWTCARTDEPVATPRICRSNASARMVIEFPDCWDGSSLDSVTHLSHVRYDNHASCPSGYAHRLPRITVEVRYGHIATKHLAASSGTITSMHADLIIAWSRERIRAEYESCIRRDVVCDLTWQTAIGTP